MKKLCLLLSICSISLNCIAQQYEFSKKGQLQLVESKPSIEPVETERFNLHFQTTYIAQYKPSFYSAYQGTNSLTGKEETQNSITSTLYLGARLWKGAEVYVNPELAGGRGLSGALGMAGASNGETFRVGDPAPSLYLGRAFLQQTFSLNRKSEPELNSIEDDQNKLSGFEPNRYLRFYLGKLSIGDRFDNNDYSNSARTQFMNWSLMNNGAWDYSANTRGYTLGLVTELKLNKWAYRIGFTALPRAANGSDMNEDIAKAYAINAEVNKEIAINKRPGHVRLLGYYNTANMGNYLDAISTGIVLHRSSPDIDMVGKYGNSKLGFGLNIDQELSDTWGFFGRIGWNDGKNETWCFTEIDQTLSLGLLANGKRWHRAEDNLGVALVANGISKDHQQYLRMGGYGFIIGDGALTYAPEGIAEVFYSYKPIDKKIWLTGDYQFCVNPAYNSDRGPVSIFSVRLHVEL